MDNIRPSSFLQTLDNCSGPTRYKSQPSRESYAPTLNDYTSKYVTGEYTDMSFHRMVETLKRFDRQWTKVPQKIKGEFLELILKGTGNLSKALKVKIDEDIGNVEFFSNDISKITNCKSEKEAVGMLNEFIAKAAESNDVLKNVEYNNKKNNKIVLSILVLAILVLILVLYFN